MGECLWQEAIQEPLSVFWRMRAAVKRAFKNGGKKQLKFQYDPSSYALNFDDGCLHLRDAAKKFIGDALEALKPPLSSHAWCLMFFFKFLVSKVFNVLF
ncbi:hypothetical protein SESBI_00031 [Sesbania bispinosa]|nr:hypothetical protein SESBI_00031 [Sesbania bispinosa]